MADTGTARGRQGDSGPVCRDNRDEGSEAKLTPGSVERGEKEEKEEEEDEEEKEKELWCAICLSILRRPRQLPCGHAYCLHCLQQLAPRTSTSLLCPSCRDVSTLPPQGVEALYVDPTLLRAVERAREKRREKIREKRKQACSVCRQVSLCSSCPHCNQLYCLACTAAHSVTLRAEVDAMTARLEKLKKQLQVETHQDSAGDTGSSGRRVSRNKSLLKRSGRSSSSILSGTQDDSSAAGGGDTKRVLFTLRRALNSSKLLMGEQQLPQQVHKSSSGQALPQLQMESLAHQRVFLHKLMASLEQRLTHCDLHSRVSDRRAARGHSKNKSAAKRPPGQSETEILLQETSGDDRGHHSHESETEAEESSRLLSSASEVREGACVSSSRDSSVRRRASRSRSKDKYYSIADEKHPINLPFIGRNCNSSEGTNGNGSCISSDLNSMDLNHHTKRPQSATRSRSRSQSRYRSLKTSNRSQSRGALKRHDIDAGEINSCSEASNSGVRSGRSSRGCGVESSGLIYASRDKESSGIRPCSNSACSSTPCSSTPYSSSPCSSSSCSSSPCNSRASLSPDSANTEEHQQPPSSAVVNPEQALEDHSLFYRCKPSRSQQRLRHRSSLRRPTDVAWCHWNNVIYVTASQFAKVIMFPGSEVGQNTRGGHSRGGSGSHAAGASDRHATWGVRGNSAGQLLCPSGVACSPTVQELYVLDKWRCRVLVFTLDGRFLREFGGKGAGPGQLSAPEGLAVDGEGLLYVADTCNDRVQVLTREGCFLRELGVRELRQPAGVAVSRDGGTVLVADTGNHRCRVYSGASGRLKRTLGGRGSNQGQMDSPECVALDQFGFMLVGDSGNNRIQMFRPNGNFVRYLGCRSREGGELRLVTGLSVVPSLGVLAADFAQHAVLVY